MHGQLAKHSGVKSKPARVNVACEVPWQVIAEVALKIWRNWIGIEKGRHLTRGKMSQSFICSTKIH